MRNRWGSATIQSGASGNEASAFLRGADKNSHCRTAGAAYARVSNNEHKKNMETQAERLTSWCNAHGWSVAKVIQECSSRINDHRPKLLALLTDPKISLCPTLWAQASHTQKGAIPGCLIVEWIRKQ